jgi:hypothetical protein
MPQLGQILHFAPHTLCSLRVICYMGGQGPQPLNVRFAPKPTKVSRQCSMSLRATSGLMHCSKQRLYSITSSVMTSNDGGTVRPWSRPWSSFDGFLDDVKLCRFGQVGTVLRVHIKVARLKTVDFLLDLTNHVT